jgi:hypothetical protein
LDQGGAEAGRSRISGDSSVWRASELRHAVRRRISGDLYYFVRFFTKFRTVGRGGEKRLDGAGCRQICKRKIAQDFAAIMHALQCRNRFFAGVDITQADGVEFEDRCAEHAKQKNRDHDFWEGHSGGCCLSDLHCLLGRKTEHRACLFLATAIVTVNLEKLS